MSRTWCGSGPWGEAWRPGRCRGTAEGAACISSQHREKRFTSEEVTASEVVTHRCGWRRPACGRADFFPGAGLRPGDGLDDDLRFGAAADEDVAQPAAVVIEVEDVRPAGLGGARRLDADLVGVQAVVAVGVPGGEQLDDRVDDQIPDLRGKAVAVFAGGLGPVDGPGRSGDVSVTRALTAPGVTSRGRRVS